MPMYGISRPSPRPAGEKAAMSICRHTIKRYLLIPGRFSIVRQRSCRHDGVVRTVAPFFFNSDRDRKSVVKGKSVSVRVDLGGRRSIKQKDKLSCTKSATYTYT